MLFNSIIFLFGFLPWALLGFWLLNRYQNARLWFLCVASVVFYGYWDWRFVPLLVGAIIVNWLAAQAYIKTKQRWILVVGIIVNLISLGLFKYLGFFAEIAQEATGWQGSFARLALPLGISFFTFHNIIYLADLLKGRAPRYGFRDYALYIALFPQILAGPLVRHNEIVPQFSKAPLRDGFYERLARGMVLLLIGLAKKIFLADELAHIADPVFAKAAHGVITTGQAWTAVLGFPLQIYFDFSGYSDMAIGIALMLGFMLPYNFDAPYRAISLSQFWRRWHMTLMRFLRDYVYIPLGGNRSGTIRQCLNAIITFLLGGLWHGAGWTFIIWGGMHGVGLAIGVLWRKWFKPLPVAISWPLLILFLIVTWIFFRAPSLAAVHQIFTALAGHAEHGRFRGMSTMLVAAAIALIGPTSQVFVERLKPSLWLAAATSLAAVVILFKLNGSPAYEFIYFHF